MTIGNYLNTITLLLVEDDRADAELLKDALSSLRYITVNLLCANSLSSAFTYMDDGQLDVIISDLGLPDSQGLSTLVKISEKVPEVPVIVLTGYDDEELAVGALKSGAQDYLVKGQIDINILYRSIRYSIERNRLIQQLKSISITDELTGLYNRRGFLMLARKQLELAARINKTMWLIYMDVDSMKWINDNLGHQEGDNALRDTANILKRTFRESDILARIGGDEFAVIALEDSKTGADSMISRISADMASFNAQGTRTYQLSVSMGAVACDTRADCDISTLLSMADKLMYEQKITKK
ncbi:MAG: diguanylate cyclase [Dissulfurispiraceae bacterium]|jgi:two-component system, cell cycle response regulator